MNSNRKLTEEQYFELVEYARIVLKEDPKCSSIKEWVHVHGYAFEHFLIAYTFIKHGKSDDASYNAVVNEFKEKHKIELEKEYSLHHQSFLSSHQESPLYQAVIQEIERSQNKESDVKRGQVLT